MAFDGITIHALTLELNGILSGGRIYKIAQPERDEILLTVKSPQEQYRLLISVNASLPLMYLTSGNKPSPITAPGFCMLLRKHINNGRILSVSQPGLERVIDLTIEHLDEMGDLCTKHLMVELMGKHSNIIFTDDSHTIIDSIKRINAGISSVREVLPGLPYFIPDTNHKMDALTAEKTQFSQMLSENPLPLSKAVYTSYTGISPQIAEYLCALAELDSRIPAKELSENERLHLSTIFFQVIEDVKEGAFTPAIFYENGVPAEYGVLDGMAQLYPAKEHSFTVFQSVSEVLETYYAQKSTINRVKSRSADLRQVVATLLERNYKKYDLQKKQLDDTDKREQYKIYGELLSAYAYQIISGSKSCDVLNYYTNETVTIPLDADLSIQENSQKYFAKYNKLKRTYEALSKLILQTESEINHLESILTSLMIAADYEDLLQIKEEMIAYGYLKKGASKGKPERSKSRPFHYRSSDGYDIYVGKNNLQNEELTFKAAAGDDWWFHAKGMPGSHVIVKTNHETLPDKTFEEAAALAAYYSKGAGQEKVEIDYIERKHLKKVAGAAPGFVIYHTNYSMNISPDISSVTLISS